MRRLLLIIHIFCWPTLVWAQQRQECHELSHALVAQDLGAIVNRISLEQTAEEAGQMYIYDRNLPKRQRAMICLAGYAGERVFLGINNPAQSESDFKEARRVYEGNLNALLPEVAAILRRHQQHVRTLADELRQSGSMTGQRFRALIGAPEPGPEHPANKAEGADTGHRVGGYRIKTGGKPSWAGDGWNQAYTDRQDQWEGPLCLGFAAVLAAWGATMIARGHRNMFDGRGEHNLYLVCLAGLLVWVSISTYVMYGSRPSN
jgi:hypothetical protein